jgi:PBP1b-binding outer membrane lipoprotein LpoB
MRKLSTVLAAAVAAFALTGCGGDDAGADAEAQTAAEPAETLASPEQERLLRDEAQRVQRIVEDAISELREVRSLDDLERHATDATDELAEARARIEALELADEQAGARDQLVGAVETLERQVRELQATIADQDPVGALQRAGELALDELEAAIERIRREVGG